MTEIEEDVHADTMEVMKQLVGELRSLNERLAFAESEVRDLRKSIADPETLMLSAGWVRYATPHADETFDPLNRQGTDNEIVGPFAGSGDTFQKSKSRYDELQEWIEAEEMMEGGL